MKRRNLKYFTLMELLFVIGILVVLIGISWVAGTKVLRSQTKAKTKAEIKLLVSAMEQYKNRYGYYPHPAGYNGEINFGEHLSKAPINSGFTGNRPMFVDYDSVDIIYDLASGTSYAANNAVATTIKDPYETTYFYQHNPTDNKILIYSYGLDGYSTNPNNFNTDYDPSANYNEDNVVSNDL